MASPMQEVGSMATLIPHITFGSPSISTRHPSFKKTHKKSLLRISKTPRKPIHLKGAFLSPTRSISSNYNQNQCLDEALSLALDFCASEKFLSQGRQIHTHIVKGNNVCDLVFLNTKLVLMYGKCGCLLYAERVFDGMFERNIFTYNAMLGAYASNGELLKAIELYADMGILDIPVDAHTFSCVLKACGGVKDLFVGREIHALAIKFGFVCNDILLNSLVSMYYKCNDLNAAELLFHRISSRGDVVLWNLMISAYSVNGMRKEAFRLLVEMWNLGVTPSTYTFVAALQACEERILGSSGMEIHAVVLKSGFHYNIYVANALLIMYARSGKLNEAEKVFLRMDEGDYVSWNSMLSGYVQNGLHNEALDLFADIFRDGQKPDHVSIIGVLSACGRSGKLLNGMEVHAFALKNELDLELQVGNTLIDMYAKCTEISYMDSVFHRMPCKDYISWTTIIAGYVENNFHMKAFELFRKVQSEGMDADRVMIESILLACHGLKCILHVKEIHCYMMRRELSDRILQNTLLDVYGECGHVDYACNIFDLIEVKNIVSWTSMIACYVHNGLAYKALKLSSYMVKSGVELDSIALLSMLSAAADLSAPRKGKEIHGHLLRKCFVLEGPIASSLVDMYASCGTVDNSYKVFCHIKDKDLVSWTSMINAYGMHGHGRRAVDLFRKMEAEKLLPDHVAFLALLYACSHSSMVDEGKQFFEIMRHQYKLEPWPEHYVCLVDLLGRANYVEEAFQIIKCMKMEPTAAVWCALLGACRIHSNSEIGEIAARKLLEIEPVNPGNYVLVSNMYAAEDRWEDVEAVRMRMKITGLRKDPACSWIEVGNTVHTFIARDRSHPDSDGIYSKLAQITEKLENEGGYVAQTRYVLHNVEEKEKVKMLYGHSERLAIAYGLLTTPKRTTIRIMKNLRVCGDCHTFTKLISKFFEREIVVRDANRFHHFKDGVCSCGDIW
ncbi:pentatricopeptide repeat-containing protein At3g63370, chloroplastic [Olea europaea var. sylvestris]|uniref:pentatricopeptide repeat-containing protein At3g63370, chloroplastic n=1 Tax=Olea europaea var. sylvestris TaxID=158386 RepID=UPI000C1D20D3|nr:pentatricopeptide repeat-containing protein At3g63370, chloroplastic [Olea europaea var. sylvestris]